MNRAKGELEALSEWLADDMSWTLIEKSTHSYGLERRLPRVLFLKMH